MKIRLFLLALVLLAPVTTLQKQKKAGQAEPLVSAITLTPLVSGLNNPIGIDYHQPTDTVVISVNFPDNQPYIFERVNRNGTHAQFTNVSGFIEEIKIAIARQDKACSTLSVGGFTPGDMFTGTGTAGQIARISSDGSVIQIPWVTLPGEPGIIRGSLAFDTTGIFGGDLIVVTNAGGVWRVTSAGVPTLIANLGRSAEGHTVIPNDPVKYGPIAGKILIAGTPFPFAPGQGSDDDFTTVDVAGNMATIQLGIDEPEDIDIIPPGGDLFALDPTRDILFFASASQFTGMVGDIVVTQEHPGVLHRVVWNGATFVTNELYRGGTDTFTSQFEHVTFSSQPVASCEVPQIFCPNGVCVGTPNIQAVGATVTFNAPQVPACATVTCTPPSGAIFPLGQTTVTCTANSCSGASTCSFPVTVGGGTAFNVCIQDDSNGSTLALNTVTGAYSFCCANGFTASGVGNIQVQGGLITFNDMGNCIVARIDTMSRRASAALKSPMPVLQCSITDRNIRDNDCSGCVCR